jgi:hypothetical protein
MNNECGATHYIRGERFICNRTLSHSGSHIHTDYARRETSWPRVGESWLSNPANPAGRGNGKTAYQQWFDDEWNRLQALKKEAEPGVHPVLLTKEDLKVIAYYLSAADEKHDSDDMPVVAKIDAALKRSL